MSEIDLVEFEAKAKTNGDAYWSAHEFGELLGYTDYKGFERVINRAIRACASLNIPTLDNFRSSLTSINGRLVPDIELSRFACYLVAMNADSRKPEVAKAQAYLAGLAQAISEYVEAAQQVDRLVIRGDLADEEKSLASAAHTHKVENYGLFQNAGYRGMYNMNLTDLKALKGVPNGRSPLDFMHSEELAANLFRITQTKAKITNEGIMGQKGLERAAETVGKTVRRTMHELSGTLPEELPPANDIKDVRASLRATHRELKKLDGPKRKRKGDSGSPL